MNVWNGERDVLEALRSIAGQTHADFEAVVWDDGSTDGTVALVEAFCAADDRFRLVVSPRNEGLVAGRRQAIARTTGTWIALCDADDVWLPQRLERQLAAIAAHDTARADSPPIVALGADGHHINADGRVVGLFDAGVHDVATYRRMRRDGGVFHLLNSSSLFRRDVYELVGGYRQDYYPGEDVDLWTRMAEHGLVLNLPEVLVQYRVHGGSISDRGLVRQMLNTRRVGVNARRRAAGLPELSHEAHLAELADDPAERRRLLVAWTAQALYRSAGGALANGDVGRGVRLMARAALVDPRVPAQRLRRQLLRRDLLARLLRRGLPVQLLRRR